MSARLGPAGSYVVRAIVRHLPPRGRGIRLARWWLQLRPPGEAPLCSREASGLRLRCDLRDELARDVFFRGWVDPGVERWLRSWLRGGDVYVDVGAHIGFYVSLALEAVGPGGSVVAIEPLPVNHSKLEESVAEARERYPHVKVVHAAAGAEDGTARIFEPRGGWANQTYRASTLPGENLGAGTVVPMRALDGILGDRTARLIKIDVEGSEAAVLRGASVLLSERRAGAVLIELNSTALERAGSSPTEIVSMLVSFGYRPHAIGEYGALETFHGPDSRTEFSNVVFLLAS